PVNLIGRVDVYLVAHHGGSDAAEPATFAAFDPRLAIVNNGPTKGGGAEMLALLHELPAVDVWQLHRAEAVGARNVSEDHIANLDNASANGIEVMARGDGSFRVLNRRTGNETAYAPRK